MGQRITNLFTLLFLLLGLLAVTSHAQGGSTNQPAREALKQAKEKIAGETPANEAPEDEEPAGSTFNGQHVPPMVALGKTYEENVSHGYWYVSEKNMGQNTL